ncbi:MAG: Hsp20 family protein [Bryobacteraceae bacterium]
MPTLPIQKAKMAERASLPVFGELEKMLRDIQRRAFELFERRGFELGHELEDWLAAEREVMSPPAAELVEMPAEFRARIAIPGFDAKEVTITATPEEIVVRAEHPAPPADAPKDMKVLWSELGNGKFCRRIPMPAAIDPDRTTATLENGMLILTSAKAAVAAPKPIAIAAAA